MEIIASTIAPTDIACDSLILFVPQEKEGKTKSYLATSHLAQMDAATDRYLMQVLDAEEFDGEKGKTVSAHLHGDLKAKRIVVTGMGDETKLTHFDFQTLVATAARRARDMKSSTVAVALPDSVGGWEPDAVARDVVEGVILGTYGFHLHKAEEARKKHKAITTLILCTIPSYEKRVTSGMKRGEAEAEAVVFARNIINEPPSYTTPSHLATVACDLADANPGITCEVWGRKEMEKAGMGALLGIARGSDEEPKFIRLNYLTGAKRTVVVAGKGITFDTGGLSLKPSEHMETMKMDMAGAAAVLAVFTALPKFKPDVNVVGLIAATENMPSGHALKPGDIVTAMDGKSIEVINTDAEGRVVLADAMAYAGKHVKADAIVDLATLTGACVVALGEDIAGMFSTDKTLSAQLMEASRETGDRLWEMPLVPEYRKLMDSPVADIKNISSTRYGGAITGALFIRDFVPEGTPWAHLDIAGPAFAEKDAPMTPVGATGFGVRLMLSYLEKQA